MKSNRAFVGNGYLLQRYSHCFDVRMPCNEGKIWTGTLANSAKPDQTPQNATSDQGLHCLLKLQEVKG